jgi:hypothetical protein
VNEKMVDEIANAVLYEGYLLYPYRASSLKNRHRFNFGVVVPHDVAEVNGADRWLVQTECLLRASLDAGVTVRVRFLHLFESGQQPASSAGWQEAVERDVRVEVAVGAIVEQPIQRAFAFDAESNGQEGVSGQVDVAGEVITDGLVKIRVVIANQAAATTTPSADRTGILKSSLLSTHAILQVTNGGEFVSLMDPPDDLQTAVSGCQNLGLWPVMVGDAHERDAMLASPIILYDYPQIAPESAGDFFDGTEIDEMLALRVMTMTDEEKAQARRTDPRARALLDRTEGLSDEHLMRLHGVLRGLRPVGESSA